MVALAAGLLVVVGATPTSQPALPARTSQYNVGDAPGRHRGPDGKIKRFELKSPTPLFDGGGREIGRVEQPVLLNVGAGKRMDLDGKSGTEEYLWAWNTDAGSGWVARDAIVDAPKFEIDTTRNPKPPGEAKTPLVIDAAKGTLLLTGLRHTNSQGGHPRRRREQGRALRRPKPRQEGLRLPALRLPQRAARRRRPRLDPRWRALHPSAQ
jgi:hypothetical protein